MTGPERGDTPGHRTEGDAQSTISGQRISHQDTEPVNLDSMLRVS